MIYAQSPPWAAGNLCHSMIHTTTTNHANLTAVSYWITERVDSFLILQSIINLSAGTSEDRSVIMSKESFFSHINGGFGLYFKADEHSPALVTGQRQSALELTDALAS